MSGRSMVVCARPSVFKSFFAATQRLRLSRLFRWRRAPMMFGSARGPFRSASRKRSTVFTGFTLHLPDDDFVKEHLNEWLN